MATSTVSEPIPVPSNSTARGPIADVYKNPYEFSSLTYPRDLGSSKRKHIIQFDVEVPIPGFKPPVAEQGSAAIAALGTIVSSGGTAITSALSGDIRGGLENLFNVTGAQLQQGQPLPELFKTLTAADVPRQTARSIFLYVPDTVNVQYSAQYDELSLASILGKPYFIAQAGASLFNEYKNAQGSGIDVDKIINAVGGDPYVRSVIGNILGGASASNLLTAGVGQALNPQLQVIFSAVGFRSFQFDFTLTPYSKQEAETIKKIVTVFKYAAAPEIQKQAIFGQGLFYKVPDRFNIKFLYDGEENKNVHKIAKCVLENINVDYAPMGWATFEDGNPVQTKLTLQFKEVEIIDKERIKQGY